MEKLFILLILLAGLVITLLSFRQKSTQPTKANRHEVIITGHRGAGGLMPENSLAAIKKGIEVGANRIEIDVHQTADSVIVVMHDDSIDRTTNGKGKIKKKTWQELQAFTLKPLLQDDTATHVIPTLEQAIDAVNGKAVLLIELKHGNDQYPGIEARVIEIIKKKQALNWCIIQSFSDDILNTVHQQEPRIPLHKLLAVGFLYNPNKLPFVKEISVYRRGFTHAFIEKVHQAGKKLNVWTVNNQDDIEYLFKMGVDGIITDFPDLGRQAALKHKALDSHP